MVLSSHKSSLSQIDKRQQSERKCFLFVKSTFNVFFRKVPLILCTCSCFSLIKVPLKSFWKGTFNLLGALMFLFGKSTFKIFFRKVPLISYTRCKNHTLQFLISQLSFSIFDNFCFIKFH